MGRYNTKIVYAVTQIKTKFSDELGNSRTGTGTGFFLTKTNGEIVYVTNKHNLDPVLLGLGAGYQLSGLEIQQREYKNNSFTPNTRFIKVDLNSTQIIYSEIADVSIVISPKFIDQEPSYLHYSLNAEQNLADEKFHLESMEIMDHVSFFGFPGTSSSSWWDMEWNMPIARIASIASLPFIPFSHKEIPTSDVTLVSGLSFTGSSGSLVLLHQKGMPPGDLIDPSYVAPKIIGIMSGHFKEKPSQESEMFRAHSGLSYYTRSTTIIELLK